MLVGGHHGPLNVTHSSALGPNWLVDGAQLDATLGQFPLVKTASNLAFTASHSLQAAASGGLLATTQTVICTILGDVVDAGGTPGAGTSRHIGVSGLVSTHSVGLHMHTHCVQRRTKQVEFERRGGLLVVVMTQ